MDLLGFEPRASALQRQRSSTDLQARERREIHKNGSPEDLSVYRHLASGSFFSLGGDPAADSPTATLLRLNPPCEIQVRTRHRVRALTHTSLGWFDGRCVQGAGTYSPRYVETRLLRIPASRGRVTALDPN
jgi:hypothetical protein